MPVAIEDDDSITWRTWNGCGRADSGPDAGLDRGMAEPDEGMASTAESQVTREPVLA
jgi:hypothetical protein